MSFALIDHATAAAAAGGTATTAAINSAGAKLLIIVATDYTHDSSTDTIVDSKGNTYTHLTNAAGADNDVCIWYCLNPASVGSGHTASSTGSYTALSFSAWSAAGTVSFDQQNTNITASGNSVQPGSITPSANGALIITGQSAFNPADATPTVSGFTVLDWRVAAGGTNVDNGVAYLIQSTAAAVSPTWSGFGVFASRAAAIASFIESGAPPAGGLFLPAALNGLGSGGPFFQNPLN